MFSTPVTPLPYKYKIDYHDQIITAGSCFADCMGQRLQRNKFKSLVNPFGTVYNPISLNRQFLMAINKNLNHTKNITDLQGLYVHYDFHSSFAKDSEETLKESISSVIDEVHYFLKNSKYLILTWGTAWIYKLKEDNSIVANCHKQPARNFEKQLLIPKDIVDDFQRFYATLKEFNKEIRIILTVSPVRHLKDTLELNSVSKGILRYAAHQVQQLEDVHYFPSYEIMVDELRDYRYYKEDMIHPTTQAEDYIWEKFLTVCVNENSLEFISQWNEIRKALNHRPFNPKSEAHQKFLRNTLTKLHQLNEQVNVEKEIEYIKKQL